MKNLRTSVALILLIAGAGHAHAYKLFTTDVASPVRERQWQNFSGISYRVSTQSPANLTTSQIVQAAQDAYGTWGNVSGSAISFTYAGTTTAGFDLGDNSNVIGVQSTGTWMGGSGVLGFAQSLVVSSGANQGYIRESDIVLNGINFSWSVDGQQVGGGTTYDLQSTMTHEVGHKSGLDHTPINGATMYYSAPSIGQGAGTGLERRSLSSDDRTGLRVLYGSAAGTGNITGTITTPSGQPGHVVGVVNMDTGETTAVFTRTRINLGNQQYRFERLPPGQYILFTRPLGLDSLSASPGNFSGGSNYDTNFRARFYRAGQSGGTPDPAQATIINVAAGGTQTASITPPTGAQEEILIAAANFQGDFSPAGAVASGTPTTIDLVYQSPTSVSRTPVLLGGGTTMSPLTFSGLSYSDGRRIYRSTIQFQQATAGTVRTIAVPYADGTEVTIGTGMLKVLFDLDPPDPGPDPVEIESDLWMLR